jgi:hypothetical protein
VPLTRAALRPRRATLHEIGSRDPKRASRDPEIASVVVAPRVRGAYSAFVIGSGRDGAYAIAVHPAGELAGAAAFENTNDVDSPLGLSIAARARRYGGLASLDASGRTLELSLPDS